MAKLFQLKVEHCIKCPMLGPVGAYCGLDIENTDPIVMHDVLRNGGIYSGCKLKDYPKDGSI